MKNKKILALILSFTMIIGSLPVTVLANETEGPSDPEQVIAESQEDEQSTLPEADDTNAPDDTSEDIQEPPQDTQQPEDEEEQSQVMEADTMNAPASVSYTEYGWNENTKTHTQTLKSTYDYTVVTSDIMNSYPDGLTSGDYVVTSDTAISDYVYVAKGATVNLIVDKGVTLTCSQGLGCGYNKNNQYASLNIFGSGKIVANGKKYAAGIGGDRNETNGNITIHGTNVTATGGTYAAGIGGGDEGKDPDGTTSIRIYDGTVNATGGNEGAGIGGGNEQPGAHTYIYSGNITAKSKKLGAGIGGGDEEGTLGIFIYGGEITATGGNHGAGIGAGEGGGNLRKAEDGGGINIMGGKITATAGSGAAGIGGGFNEHMSGDISISGTVTLTAEAGEGAAGIGAGSMDGSWFTHKSDMKGTIRIDCTAQSVIFVYALPSELVREHDYIQYTYVKEYRGYKGAGIGAGWGGNMTGKVYITGGNLNVYSGVGGAGIGGGFENSKAGGEGNDVYIGGGDITITAVCYNDNGDNESTSNHAIGRGHCDSKDGSVYIHPNNNTTGKYMRVVYTEFDKYMNDDPKETKTASASDRSKKCHTKSVLHITKCDHKDHNGNSGLSYTIVGDMHKYKCKYCGYEATESHSGNDCICGWKRPSCTVTLSEDNTAFESTYTVAAGSDFVLPEGNDYDYFNFTNRFSEWRYNGQSYAPGDAVTVNSDITIGAMYDKAYYVTIKSIGMTNGTVTADKNMATEGEWVVVSPQPDDGYQVDSVTISGDVYTTDGYDNYYEKLSPGEDGRYSFRMPAGKMNVSAEFTKAPNYITIGEVENGTVTSDKAEAEAGETVTITAVQDHGYYLDQLHCKATDGTRIDLTMVDDNHFTFVMPDMSVNVSAEFEPFEYMVTFAKGDDSAAGDMEYVSVPYDTDYVLPDCGFTAPDGKVFSGWTVDDGTEIKSAGDTVTIKDNITLTAHYDYSAALKGYKLSLDGDIGVNFYMEIAGDLIDDNTYMLFNVSGAGAEYQTQKVYLTDDSTKTIGGVTYYVFKCRVAAKEMTAAITAQLYNGENTASAVYTYSVKDYAEYILAHADQSAEYGKAAPLVKAMLNYGTAAQDYFGVNTDDPANETEYMTAIEKVVKSIKSSDINAPASVIPALPEGVSFDGASVSLKSETTLSLYFTSDKDLTFSCDGGYTVDPVESGKYQIARIRGIRAEDLDKTIKLTVTCEGASFDIEYSVLNYCKNALDGAHPELEPIVTALYRYYEAAEAYKSSNT